jgi:Tat protein translocase TatB subunit
VPNLGPLEIAIVFIVALIVLGPKRLPEAGRQVGRALAEVRRWSAGVQQDLREALEPEPQPMPPTPVPQTELGPGEPQAEPPRPTPSDLDPRTGD